MKYHIVWITTAGMTFCKMFHKSLSDYYHSFTNEGVDVCKLSRKLIVKFKL